MVFFDSKRTLGCFADGVGGLVTNSKYSGNSAMALCVRAFAHVSVAHRLHHVSLLSSSLWGGQARPCVRFQLKTGRSYLPLYYSSSSLQILLVILVIQMVQMDLIVVDP